MSWIFYTIAATILQTLRNLEQKALSRNLDALTVSWSRFILPLPFALLAIFYNYDGINSRFIFYAMITAMMQILANVFLLKTFKSKNFNIGVAFYKTETLQALFLGLIFFGEKISYMGIFFVIIAMIGVVLMSGSIFNQGWRKFLQSLKNQAAFYGLLCGLFFSISAFFVKFTAQAFASEKYSIIEAAIFTLLWVIIFQNLIISLIKILQKRFFSDLQKLLRSENKYAFFRTSILSFLGSVCWFIAFGIGTVVYVKVVGQLELVWSSVASYYILREEIKPLESWGIIFTVLGIIGVILWH